MRFIGGGFYFEASESKALTENSSGICGKRRQAGSGAQDGPCLTFWLLLSVVNCHPFDVYVCDLNEHVLRRTSYFIFIHGMNLNL